MLLRRSAITLALTSGALLLAGCFNLARFSDQVDANNFESARAILMEEKAYGATVPPETDEKLIRARDIYRRGVERDSFARRDAWLKKGMAKSASAAVERGIELCPWSQDLPASLSEIKRTIERLDRLDAVWSKRENPENVEQAAELLAVPQDVRRLAREHSVLWQRLLAADGVAMSDSARVIGDLAADEASVRGSVDRLRILTLEEDIPKQLATSIEVASACVQRATPTAFKSWSDALKATIDMRNTYRGGEWQVIAEAAYRRMELWCGEVLFPACSRERVPFETLQALLASESRLASLKPARDWRTATAKAFHGRAEWLSGMGIEAALALVYERVAQSRAADLEGASQVATRSIAAMGNALPLRIDFRVRVTTGADATIAGFLKEVAERVIDRQNKSLVMPVENPGESGHRVELTISDWTLVADRADALPRKTSRYLSHYESVPNPQKASLRRSLDFDEAQVDSARSSLDWAISSYNINPTTYALNSVNSARTRYNFAVSQYNTAVAIYNATPATITQPVYLPYTFIEGTIRHGWRLSAVLRINDHQYPLTPVEIIDTDFVRIGARVSDVVPENRNDDPSTLDLSTDRSFSLLFSSIRRLVGQVSPLLVEIPLSPQRELAEAEQRMLAAMFHPWGLLEQEKALPVWPMWAPRVSMDEILKVAAPTLPTIALKRPDTPYPKTVDLATASGHVRDSVCQILALDAGKVVSTGTGVLIGPEGLVLSCAHVLHGSEVQLSFGDGQERRRFSARVLYQDRRNDVAVLQGIDLRNDRWVAIRLDGRCSAGEPVFALGYPGSEVAGAGSLVVTQGTVAAPFIEYSGTPQVMLDINIASGSSGGPVFSLTTGEVIGIVESVVSPKITETFGRSGFAAFALPGCELNRLVGLKYE